MMGMSYRVSYYTMASELGFIKRSVLHNSRSWLTERLLFFIVMRKASKKSTGLEIRPRGDITEKKDAAHV